MKPLRCLSRQSRDPVGAMRTSPLILLFVCPPLKQDEAGLAALSIRMAALRRDHQPTG